MVIWPELRGIALIGNENLVGLTACRRMSRRYTQIDAVGEDFSNWRRGNEGWKVYIWFTNFECSKQVVPSLPGEVQPSTLLVDLEITGAIAASPSEEALTKFLGEIVRQDDADEAKGFKSNTSSSPPSRSSLNFTIPPLNLTNTWVLPRWDGIPYISIPGW